jgi:hypothetical protein
MKTWMYAAIGLIVVQALVLYLFGQPPICTCDSVKLWEGTVLGPGNSQHLTDWYTYSHVIHGLLFYLGLWYFFPRLSVWQRLACAVFIEAAWEIAENTPVVINHYRQQALAAGYTGDSIINSVSDTCAMVLGFLVARKWPLWAAIALGLGFELWVAYSIRDNLALNVVNLIYQFDIISAWQSGASH